MDRELLIEIGVEELPAGWMPDLTRQLKDAVEARLRGMRMAPDVPVETFSTPRRLTARIGRIPERQEDLDEEVTGPPVSAAFTPSGEPTPAALGFARKQGLAFEALERKGTPKGTYLLARRRQRGKSAVDALPDLLAGLLRDLPFPKQMHWDAMLDDGRGELQFGRPIRWLLFLYGGRVVPFTIGRMPNAAGPLVQEVSTGAVTYGHRFLATSGRAGRSIKVRTFDDYRARLGEHFVILDHAERRDRIARELELKSRKLGGRVVLRDHAALVDEVADLVEYPGVVAGFFERSFLELPHEVLTTTLVHHQHYFPVTDDKGQLKEAFLAVVNTSPADERPIARNAERVVTARLRDAKFFWDTDRRTRLEDRLERLHPVVFHKKLGSYRDKAQRIERVARVIAADAFDHADQADGAAKAARLAKTDLTTDMVFEFPELQGTMGGIYARAEGFPEQVWKAIYHQYLPLGVEPDAPPTRNQLGTAAIAWAAVALADKIDSVVGLMKVGERATGSRDPFGLRRQTQGIVKILMDLPELAGIDREIGIGALVEIADPLLPGAAGPSWDPASVATFAQERIRYALEQRGFSLGQIRSAVSGANHDNPLRARRIAEALKGLEGSDDLRALAVLFKRVKNIARELKEHAKLDRSALTEPAEAALLSDLDARRPRIAQAIGAKDYRRALTEIAGLRPSVDRFFTEVFVMVEDARLRTARLMLMADLRDLVLDLADISEIVPQAE
jgi:glycyl-tRNA synthetase beta chain